MRELEADQVRAMTFVPREGIPIRMQVPPEPDTELLMIALMRLSFPDRLIPASLDVDGLAGLAARLDAGANVVTSIVPPGLGLAGVAQADRDIEEGRRTIESVRRSLETRRLKEASQGEYTAYLERRRAASSRRRPPVSTAERPAR
jgi:methylornithine synthase